MPPPPKPATILPATTCHKVAPKPLPIHKRQSCTLFSALDDIPHCTSDSKDHIREDQDALAPIDIAQFPVLQDHIVYQSGRGKLWEASTDNGLSGANGDQITCQEPIRIGETIELGSYRATCGNDKTIIQAGYKDT
ncbi:MAG: hypothetical protein LQ341_005625 [Variospora aurantia]|nr:MAG: hypothetical protein LQ341_005625 [Variospora aurantia]